MGIQFGTPRQIAKEKLARAEKVYVLAAGTEFWMRVPKSEISALAKYLGGWHRIEIDLLGEDGAYVTTTD